jgi:succinate dehydrogenase / fumarate reductase, flavoprotein subunit
VHYRGKFADTEEEGARWLDDKAKYRRPPELLPRDVVSRAIYKEVLAGRASEHGGAYLDVSHRGAEYVKRKLPSMYEQFISLGDIDITTQPMEIYPTIHYTMGGIRVEPETCAASVPGLFAAGECAAGLHGANRLGGNSLTDILVFGRRAGEAAAACTRDAEAFAPDPTEIDAEAALLLDPFTNAGSESPYAISRDLQEAMQADAMIARDAEGLTRCLGRVMELQERAKAMHVDGDRCYNPGWHTARDMRFTLKVSEIIVRSALERQESRGAQWRLDFPDKDDAWGKRNIVAEKAGNEVRLSLRPVPDLPPELKAILEET